MRRTIALIVFAIVAAPLSVSSDGSSEKLRDSGGSDRPTEPTAALTIGRSGAEGSVGAPDFLPVITVDFDTRMPDRTFYRKGGRLEVVYDPAINDSRMGVITLPSAVVPGKSRYELPQASFVVDYPGKLGNTITSFRTYVPGKPPYGRRSPYVVYKVVVDEDTGAEAFVVGSRIVASATKTLPEAERPVGTWFESRLDLDTLVHVADSRVNLGYNEFTTWNYGLLADLVKVPLRDERAWGDLDIVCVEICAGVSAGPAFQAYVDDIRVGPYPVSKPDTPLAVLEKLCRELLLGLEAEGGAAIAVPGFSSSDGEPSKLTTLLNEMVIAEITRRETLRVIEPRKIDVILQERSLALPDLVDTGVAIAVGKRLGADYILTGTVLEMPASVVVFGRIIDVTTGKIESVEQVSIPKSPELEKLL